MPDDLQAFEDELTESAEQDVRDGFSSTLFFREVERFGGQQTLGAVFGACCHLILKGASGFGRLWEAGHPERTLEHVGHNNPQFHHLFAGADVLAKCQERLSDGPEVAS